MYHSRSVTRQRTLTVLLVMLVGWALVGVSPARADVIHACVNPQSGEIKIVAPGQPCPPGKVAVELGTGGGGLRVVDSQGQEVGSVISARALIPIPTGSVLPGLTWVARLISGIWFSFGVTADGFSQGAGQCNVGGCGRAFVFYHETPDCSGVRFLLTQTNPLFRATVVSGSTAFYPGDPIQTRTFGSVEQFQAGDNLNNPGSCVVPPVGGIPFGPFDSGPATTFTVPVFAPPFSLSK